MYDCKEDVLVDESRYQLYCKNDGKIDCDQLSVCADALELHLMRPNYQAQISRELTSNRK